SSRISASASRMSGSSSTMRTLLRGTDWAMDRDGRLSASSDFPPNTLMRGARRCSRGAADKQEPAWNGCMEPSIGPTSGRRRGRGIGKRSDHDRERARASAYGRLCRGCPGRLLDVGSDGKLRIPDAWRGAVFVERGAEALHAARDLEVREAVLH